MKSKLFLTAILLLFLITRFYKISEIPPSLYWDETSIGYNAYSILTTGQDEWGNFLPIHFRAFGEFKLPVYIYSVVLTEKFLGMTELAVRLPAVLFSLGMVLLTYLIGLKIFKKKLIALFAAFCLTVSPWFFIFSRTGYEASAGLMFFLLGIYLFLLVFKNKWFLLFSVLSFILSFYSYNSFRIVTPLTFLILGGWWLKKFRTRLSKFALPLFISTIFLIISIIPIGRLMLFDQGMIRFQTIQTQNNILGILNNYFSHFSPNFLFFKGDQNLRSQQTGFGQLYFLDLPLFVLGLIFVVSQKKLLYLLPLFFILLGPLPAAITKESPHALRSLTQAPFFALISALGLNYAGEKLKWCRFLYGGVFLIYLIFFLNYFNGFVSNYKIISAKDWQYGYKQLFLNYKNEFNKFDHVVVSDQYGQPYIFGLFYLKYDPERFKSEVKLNPPDKWGFSKVAGFNNFIFQPVSLNNLPNGNLLIFAAPWEKLKGIQEKSVVRNLDKSIAFYVYQYQK